MLKYKAKQKEKQLKGMLYYTENFWEKLITFFSCRFSTFCEGNCTQILKVSTHPRKGINLKKRYIQSDASKVTFY